MQALIAALALMLAPLSGDPARQDAPAPVAAAQPDKPAEKKEPAKKAPDAKQPEKKAEPPADPATEDVIKEMEKQRGNAPPPSSATPAVPLPQAEQPKPAARPPSARLLREGTFLVDRRGRMVRTPNGDWTYTFDADAQGQSDPAMTLLPCQKLEAMEKLAERYGESLTLMVTGQVFAYRNRNYLLPATFRVVRQNQDIKSTQ